MRGDVVRVLSNCIGNFEPLLVVRVDRLKTVMNARFDRIEAMLKPLA